MIEPVIGKGKYGSDLIVDLLQRYDIPYVALNPGASFRGLHDSLVNYGGNRPEIILCQHEKIAVGIAHGYAKATGQADGRDRARHRRPAARRHGHLLRLPRPCADAGAGRNRADGHRQAAAQDRLDPHGQRCRATPCATT